MRDFSRREAAARAGIHQDTLDEIVELGIVQPAAGDRFSEGLVRKLGLLGTLLTGGIPAAAIAGELESGRFSLDFLDNPSYGTFTNLSALTFEEVLVSGAVVEASADSAVDFVTLGQVELKGAPGAIELYVARRRGP